MGLLFASEAIHQRSKWRFSLDACMHVVTETESIVRVPPIDMPAQQTNRVTQHV